MGVSDGDCSFACFSLQYRCEFVRRELAGSHRPNVAQAVQTHERGCRAIFVLHLCRRHSHLSAIDVSGDTSHWATRAPNGGPFAHECHRGTGVQTSNRLRGEGELGQRCHAGQVTISQILKSSMQLGEGATLTVNECACRAERNFKCC